jgi:hypothetical protein
MSKSTLTPIEMRIHGLIEPYLKSDLDEGSVIIVARKFHRSLSETALTRTNFSQHGFPHPLYERRSR